MRAAPNDDRVITRVVIGAQYASGSRNDRAASSDAAAATAVTDRQPLHGLTRQSRRLVMEHEHAPGRGHEADLERIHRVVLPLVRERSAGPVDPDARGHGAAAQPSVAFGFLLFARAALRASPSASTVMNPVIRRIR